MRDSPAPEISRSGRFVTVFLAFAFAFSVLLVATWIPLLGSVGDTVRLPLALVIFSCLGVVLVHRAWRYKIRPALSKTLRNLIWPNDSGESD
jgi:hypothetical protein